MELPSSSLLLKLFLLSLLTITANAIPKPRIRTNNKLIPPICQKTKNPKACFSILRMPKTISASSLHDLGEGSLESAISQAKASVGVYSHSLIKDKDVPMNNDKENIKYCRDNYEMATKKLVESKTAWSKKDYASAKKSLEVACHVPPSCVKKLGGAAREFKMLNIMSDIHFDIPLVIVKELRGER